MFGKTQTAFPAAIAISNALNTMDWSLSTSGTFRLSRWSQVKRYFAEWRCRAASRNELMNLDDRLLRDIGDARYEARNAYDYRSEYEYKTARHYVPNDWRGGERNEH
jgi:uncharacterized protein YjiS (DUF1127 family)